MVRIGFRAVPELARRFGNVSVAVVLVNGVDMFGGVGHADPERAGTKDHPVVPPWPADRERRQIDERAGARENEVVEPERLRAAALGGDLGTERLLPALAEVEPFVESDVPAASDHEMR